MYLCVRDADFAAVSTRFLELFRQCVILILFYCRIRPPALTVVASLIVVYMNGTKY